MILSAQNISRTYTIGKQVLDVLRGVDIEVQSGETVAVVGVSGAGKSTLMHILGGLDKPDRGTVALGGTDFYGLPARQRARIRSERIGFVFQAYHLLPELTVLENVGLPARSGQGRQASTREIDERALALLETVGLADWREHLPLELSGGEQQRIALARALMNEPEMILADEPTGNLDDRTGGAIIDLLFGMVRERGSTLLIVTHNRDLAARCDRVLHLTDGDLSGDRP